VKVKFTDVHADADVSLGVVVLHTVPICIYYQLTASEGFLQHRSEDPAVRRRRWTESVHMITNETYTTTTATTSNSGDSSGNSSDTLLQQPELVWVHGSIHTTKR
jgi:hypothetical protein